MLSLGSGFHRKLLSSAISAISKLPSNFEKLQTFKQISLPRILRWDHFGYLNFSKLPNWLLRIVFFFRKDSIGATIDSEKLEVAAFWAKFWWHRVKKLRQIQQNSCFANKLFCVSFFLLSRGQHLWKPSGFFLKFVLDQISKYFPQKEVFIYMRASQILVRNLF